LFVQKSASVSSDGNSLTLIDVDPQTLNFSDCPDDLAGFLSFEELVDFVSVGPDSFSDDPPNATLVVFGGDQQYARHKFQYPDEEFKPEREAPRFQERVRPEPFRIEYAHTVPDKDVRI